jgi:tRNA dimethylallyltransferase
MGESRYSGKMRALLIMGPTASGKSALAQALAMRLDGEVVNADAAQVYSDLRILSARPPPWEEEAVPHHLFGHVDAGERYSVAKWLAHAAPVLDDITARGRLAIVVGGTGLYFKALTEGLNDAPPADPQLRAELLRRLKQDGPQSLYAELAQVDPASAKVLGPRDGPRVLRALEVWHSTGVSLQAIRDSGEAMLGEGDWLGVTLWPERSALYTGINQRFTMMMTDGAMDEARALMLRGLDPDLPAMKAIGVPSLIAHLRGEMKLEAAVEQACRDSRRYAKRQFTWINGQMKAWPRLTATDLQHRTEEVVKLVAETHDGN